MRQSKLFSKTRFESPKDEVSKNADLLIRGGFIFKEMAGVYAFLPLGLRVLKKIEKVIREEMNALGGQEVFLTTLQEKELWLKSGRWDDKVVDNWFKSELKNGTQVGLANTHEEALTDIMLSYVNSFRDLPIYAYQIQTKFRNEARAKSGILRGREFMMKDLYSFSKDKKEHDEFYERSKEAYKKVFERVGLGESTYITFASGGSFSKYSHEFQTLTESGEDTIYIDEAKKIAINKEVLNDEVLNELGLRKDTLIERKAIEVGNIFTLGTRFSDALGLKYKDEKGESKQVFMGSYGIGLSRLMGTIVEIFGKEGEMIWPEEVSPFKAHLISLAGNDEEVVKVSEKLYKELTDAGIEILFDDRDMRVGEKFADADLIGIPFRIISSKKTMEKNSFEIKDRVTGEISYLNTEEIIKKYSSR
ncbi:MAG: aminoacyl--tRNA ligase-related protein [Candidatus Paceibacterota bacterium]